MTGPLDLADILAHTHWTNPAPRPGDELPPYPGPNPPTLPGPCHRPTVDELIAQSREVVADVYATIARSRAARGADRDDLGQVAR
ncbi:hypothetical protein [Micromonospora sp. C41]|uniref:hypothetical protein n=1 Tax=Micromonospora sp. C41 TaxID=2824878 RepID=UPI001B37D47F|nr:hypothetical protein [Micromonospora sp. C41]MBQ1064514.1 hypothetical protein [Micromonospora sp. C41]